jgi:hypothetical protein
MFTSCENALKRLKYKNRNVIGERTRTVMATAPSHEIPTMLAGTTPTIQSLSDNPDKRYNQCMTSVTDYFKLLITVLTICTDYMNIYNRQYNRLFDSIEVSNIASNLRKICLSLTHYAKHMLYWILKMTDSYINSITALLREWKVMF